MHFFDSEDPNAHRDAIRSAEWSAFAILSLSLRYVHVDPITETGPSNFQGRLLGFLPEPRISNKL